MRLSELVVEVLCDRGDHWTVGSGYLIGGSSVLTAAHNVETDGEALVRFQGREEIAARPYRDATGWVAVEPDLDLAVLTLENGPVAAPPVRFAAVNQDPPPNTPNVGGCWAYGFPRFRQRDDPSRPGRPLRDNVRLDGHIPIGEGLVGGTLTFKVTDTPRALPERGLASSQWQGVSGALVFAGDLAVGVITEHHLPEGDSALSVVPLTALDRLPAEEQARWWALIATDRSRLAMLPRDVRTVWSAILPARPRALVARTEQYARLCDALLDDHRPGPLVVTGIAGAGKSVVAAEVARAACPGPDGDPRLIARFSDGVTWIRVGNREPINAKQRELALALGGSDPALGDDIGAWCNYLQRLTQGKRGLLVLDDVWTLERFEALAVDQPGVRILVTTLDRTLPETIDAEAVVVQELDRTQARGLLGDLVGTPVGELPEQAERLLDQVGDLALGVAMLGSLAGDLLRRAGNLGTAAVWDGILRRLADAQLDRLTRELPGYQHNSLAAAVAVCVQDLSTEDQQRWAELAANRGAVPWPTGALQDLWAGAGLDALDTVETIRRLDRRSLVQQDAGGRVLLHDLQLAVASQRLGDRRTKVNQRLVATWRARLAAELGTSVEASFADIATAMAGRTTDDPVWSTLDDGYVLQSLSLHLVEAGLASDLHALLARGTDGAGNAWYEVLRRRGLRSQFLIDVARASASADGNDSGWPRTLLAIRYGLYAASLRTSASRVRPAVLAGMLRHGLADFADVHADLLLEPETESLAQKLGLLARSYPGQADAIVSSVGSIQDSAARCWAVVEVAPFLPEAAVPAALALARDLPDPGLRARALATLAAAAPAAPVRREIGNEALGALRAADDPELEVATLTALQPLATGDVPQALAREQVDAAWRISNSITRSRALGDAIVALLQAGLVEEAMAHLQRAPRPGEGLVVRNLVEDRVLPELPLELIRRLCASVTSTDSPEPRQLEYLALVASRLAPEEQRDLFAWALARVEAFDQDRRPSLRPFVRNAPEPELTRLQGWLRGTDGVAVGELCTRLCEAGKYDEGLQLAVAMPSKLWRVLGRLALVEGGHPQRDTLLAEALDGLPAVDVRHLPAVADELLPRLDADQTMQVAHLLASRAGDDGDLDLLLRCALTSGGHDSEGVAERAWGRALRGVEDDGEVPFTCWLALALAAGSGALRPQPDVGVVLSTLRGSSDAVFWGVPQHLHPLVPAEKVDEVLAAVTALDDDGSAMAAGVEAVVPSMTASQLEPLFDWTVRAQNGRLLGAVAAALAAADLPGLHRLVHTVSDVPLLVAARSAADPSGTAHDVFGRRLGELMLGFVGPWSTLDLGHAASAADLVAGWAGDDADHVLELVAGLDNTEVECTLTAAVVVGAPGHAHCEDRLRSLASALSPVNALCALGPAAGLGIESPALLGVAAGVRPGVEAALAAPGLDAPDLLTDSLGRLAALATGSAQEEYARLAIAATARVGIRAFRAFAVGRLASLLPSATLAGLLDAVDRLEEDGVYGPRSRASAVDGLATRFASEGRIDDALGLVDSVHDPPHRFLVVLHLAQALPSGAGVEVGWLTRPGRRPRSNWLAELAGVAAVTGHDLPASEVLRITDDCLRWWP